MNLTEEPPSTTATRYRIRARTAAGASSTPTPTLAREAPSTSKPDASPPVGPTNSLDSSSDRHDLFDSALVGSDLSSLSHLHQYSDDGVATAVKIRAHGKQGRPSLRRDHPPHLQPPQLNLSLKRKYLERHWNSSRKTRR
ncbi:hypothetical protein T439DRAFT_353370 [Meredithblackwellia eburnea MCA 4105]